MGRIAVELVSSATADVRRLIEELDQELAQLYTPDQCHGLRLDAIFQPDIRLFVARLYGAAIGCGGIAIGPESAEVKRMYVQREWRGRGVADAILDRLITEARGSGLKLIRLETGAHSAAAIRFYSRSGFRPCGPFGSFKGVPRSSVVASIFMELQLT
ncbi:MAG TPA: GNAT family N-acetyltransferase [Micropepsaceae bacterium]|nr:GNAT family N-acetyltransferase [Micropepsaceae bacterium]